MLPYSIEVPIEIADGHPIGYLRLLPALAEFVLSSVPTPSTGSAGWDKSLETIGMQRPHLFFASDRCNLGPEETSAALPTWRNQCLLLNIVRYSWVYLIEP